MRKKSTCLPAASAILGVALSISATAQTTNILPPDGTANREFGKALAVLPNGNIVVTDPKASNGSVTEAGAVYLINGTTWQVISTLRGSTTNDHVGGDGITVLSNGNFAITSTEWDNGSNTNAGAVTWGSATSGVSGVVSSSNSMVGAVSNDLIGIGGVTPLANGNYVICSYCWHNGASNYNAGAITWCSGTSATTGVVGTANSLCATTQNDALGNIGIRELSNGNYIVGALYWDNTVASAIDAGAVTWCSGTSATTGYISSTNSLVGTHAGDMIGQICVPLANGNYVTGGVDWQNGAVDEAGAIIWCDGSTGRTGVVTASMALVGSTYADKVGNGFIAPLPNGDYVVTSPMWQNGGAGAVGAVTRCNGASGTTGAVSAANSMVGNSVSDALGNGWITALPNSGFVISNASWSSATYQQEGIAMFFGPSNPCTGYFNSANAFTGGADYANAGMDVFVLANGNYIVTSPNWAPSQNNYGFGAVTWCSGTTGRTGTVSASNSLVGATDGDMVGRTIVPLTNGNYVVASPEWSSPTTQGVGATTWCNGATGRTGLVTPANSIIGTSNYEMLGQTVVALTNGNYVVTSRNWSSPTVTAVGAARLVDGSTCVSGNITSKNSITGSSSWDNVGTDVVALPGGNFIVRSDNFQSGSGAQTFSSGTSGIAGAVSTCNSVIGSSAWNGNTQKTGYQASSGTLIVGRPKDNLVSVFKPNPAGIVTANGEASAYLSGAAARTEFVESSSCRVVAALAPAGAAPVSGDVSTKAVVRSTGASFNGQAFVRRSFDITPVDNPSTATGRITLYLTQADIDDYNASNGSDPDLPTSSSHLSGIANLRVTQQHGTSATGEPGSYTGYTGSGPKSIAIDPADNNIVYNSALSRWEITFDVTGFSGFFVHGGVDATPLNLQLLQFGAVAAGPENQVSWTMANAVTASSFELERSANGKDFEAMSSVRPEGGKESYMFNDRTPFASVTYYRLKYMDLAGRIAYSNIATVRRSHTEGGVAVSPVPADNTVRLIVTDQALIGTPATIINMNGQLMQTLTLEAVSTVNVQSWPSGIYMARLADGRSLRIARK